jgi:hypothetical protein
VPADACCPITHFNSYLQQFVMIYTTWGNGSALFMATSQDGLSFGPSQLLLDVAPPRTIAYGQVHSDSADGSIGRQAVLAYAAAPPTGPYPRDFVFRSIEFSAEE